MQYVPLEIISDFIVCTFQTGQGSTGEHVYNTWLKLQECYDRKHGIFFFIREETAVKSHSLTNVGSARIMNLESEHHLFLQQTSCSCWNWDAVAGLRSSARHHEFQSRMLSRRWKTAGIKDEGQEGENSSIFVILEDLNLNHFCSVIAWFFM